MLHSFKRNSINLPLCLTLLVVWATLAHAQSALKTIDTPQGGKIVYGQVEGQTTEAGAIAAVLRSIHNRHSVKPQVGKPFHVRNTNSVAVFFTLAKGAQGNGQVAGLIIACKVAPGHIEAALVSDDASRFGSTANSMLTKLFGVWKPGGDIRRPVTALASAPVAVLRKFSLPDHSATVSLPKDWRVLPSSGGGTIIADGPDGERAVLGFPLSAMNSNDPRVRQTMRFAKGAGRNTSYAHTLYYPYGAGLAKTFVDLTQMMRRMKGLPPATFNIASEQRMPASGPSRCTHLTGQLDAKDGKGMKEMNTLFCLGPLQRYGSYMNLVYQTVVPVQHADQERATMGAILSSFSVNQAVVNKQAIGLAAPAIAQIHEIGRQTAKLAAESNAAFDAQNKSFNQRWDNNDRSNQAFSNYLLDKTVIQDNEHNAHGSVWNETADSMVRNNPQRFEYVSTPNFWKGIDY